MLQERFSAHKTWGRYTYMLVLLHLVPPLFDPVTVQLHGGKILQPLVCSVPVSFRASRENNGAVRQSCNSKNRAFTFAAAVLAVRFPNKTSNGFKMSDPPVHKQHPTICGGSLAVAKLPMTPTQTICHGMQRNVSRKTSTRALYFLILF